MYLVLIAGGYEESGEWSHFDTLTLQESEEMGRPSILFAFATFKVNVLKIAIL